VEAGGVPLNESRSRSREKGKWNLSKEDDKRRGDFKFTKGTGDKREKGSHV